MSKLEQTILALIREAAALPDVPLELDQPLYTVAIDSLDMAQIVVAVEEKFGVKLTGKDLHVPGNNMTPQYIANLVTSYLVVDAE